MRRAAFSTANCVAAKGLSFPIVSKMIAVATAIATDAKKFSPATASANVTGPCGSTISVKVNSAPTDPISR